MQFSAYDTHGFYDEMFEDSGRPRPHGQLLLETVEALSDGQLAALQARRRAIAAADGNHVQRLRRFRRERSESFRST